MLAMQKIRNLVNSHPTGAVVGGGGIFGAIITFITYYEFFEAVGWAFGKICEIIGCDSPPPPPLQELSIIEVAYIQNSNQNPSPTSPIENRPTLKSFGEENCNLQLTLRENNEGDHLNIPDIPNKFVYVFRVDYTDDRSKQRVSRLFPSAQEEKGSLSYGIYSVKCSDGHDPPEKPKTGELYFVLSSEKVENFLRENVEPSLDEIKKKNPVLVANFEGPLPPKPGEDTTKGPLSTGKQQVIGQPPAERGQSGPESPLQVEVKFKYFPTGNGLPQELNKTSSLNSSNEIRICFSKLPQEPTYVDVFTKEEASGKCFPKTTAKPFEATKENDCFPPTPSGKPVQEHALRLSEEPSGKLTIIVRATRERQTISGQDRDNLPCPTESSGSSGKEFIKSLTFEYKSLYLP